MGFDPPVASSFLARATTQPPRLMHPLASSGVGR